MIVPETLRLDWQMLFCPVHSEPFFPKWPDFTIFAQFGMLHAAASDLRILEEANHEIKELQNVIEKHAPLCEYLPAELVYRVTQTALAGEIFGRAHKQSS